MSYGTIVKAGPCAARVIGEDVDDGVSQPLIEITRTVVETARVRPVLQPCAGCGAIPHWDHQESLCFMLENHDGQRLCFPYAEGCEDERDRFPVMGWKEVDGVGLVCGECARRIASAIRKAIAR